MKRGSYLIIFGNELVQTLLDDVVAVQIFDQDHDVQAEGHDNGMDLKNGIRQSQSAAHKVKHNDAVTCLSTSGQEINHLLNSTSTVHVQRDVDQVLRD